MFKTNGSLSFVKLWSFSYVNPGALDMLVWVGYLKAVLDYVGMSAGCLIYGWLAQSGSFLSARLIGPTRYVV